MSKSVAWARLSQSELHVTPDRLAEAADLLDHADLQHLLALVYLADLECPVLLFALYHPLVQVVQLFWLFLQTFLQK